MMALHKTYKSIALIGLLLLLSICSLAQNSQHQRLTRHIKDSLKTEIETMLANDQKYRWMIEYGELDSLKIEDYKTMSQKAQYMRIKDVLDKKTGLTKTQDDSLWALQNAIDSANFIKLTAIIRTYGFPHKYIEEYIPTSMLIHSSERLDDNYFKMLREEVMLGNLEAMEYARLFDRVQIGLRLPELYYVNEHYDAATQTYHIETPKDINATNKAREEIGLKKYIVEK